MNLNEFEPMRAYWIALYVNNNNVIYFNSFEVQYIPKETKKFIENKNVMTNIYGIQAYNSIMCRYFCTKLLILC